MKAPYIIILAVNSLILHVVHDEGLSQQTCTPPTTRTWISVEDARKRIDTLWFGVDTSATRCEDRHLCEMDTPKPPPGVCFSFPRFDLFEDDCLWGGTKQDYRYFMYPAQIDTHLVMFGYCVDSTYYPFTFRWSKINIASISDSTVIRDYITGSFYKVRMDMTDSLIVTSTAINILFDYKIWRSCYKCYFVFQRDTKQLCNSTKLPKPL